MCFWIKSAPQSQTEADVRDMILIAPKSFKLSELTASFEGDANFRIVSEPNRIFIEKLKDREFIEFAKAEDVSSYYDDEEGEVFKNDIPEPDFYLIRFKSLEFLKFALLQSLNRLDIYLDNDFGLILPGAQFLAMIKQRPGWDWALD